MHLTKDTIYMHFRNDKRDLYKDVLQGYNHTPKIKKRIKEKITEFRVWDGEGKNFPDGSHKLVLLSNSDEEYIYNEDGLSTMECIKFLLQPRTKKKNVWFSFGYDVNKILTDIPILKTEQRDYANLETLWTRNTIYYNGYRIHYIPRKIFSVSLSKKETFHSTDIFTFFQVSFLKACEQWGIDASTIEQGKQDRSIFDTYTFEDILTYNFLELRYVKELVTKLYYAFYEANLVPNSWHGPGALAGTYFKQHDLSKYWGDIGKHWRKKEMDWPIACAYFGGRIDIAFVGEIDCYQYDITSAYPHALTDCISLENVFWHFNTFPFVNDRHALYHVRWNLKNPQWGPFPFRKANGTVLFPPSGQGWYWGVEVLAAEKLFGEWNGEYGIQRIAAYYPMAPKRFPFARLILDAFDERNKVGRKSGPGIAIKLILNSLYGKLCQSVGSKQWQNYIWAGYITSFTRATMLDAIRNVGEENVVAIATDGIYTKTKMEINEALIGKLGAWEYDGLATILFVGAGLYTVIKDGKAFVVKSRGMPANLNHGWVLREWGCNTTENGIGEDSMISHYTTFIGMGKAIHQNKPFGIFTKEIRELQNVVLGGTSKRLPVIDTLFSTGWKELPLQPRKIPEGASILSEPYTKNNKELVKELRIEQEIPE